MSEKENKGKNVIHIKDWPEGDRPREMLLEKGPEALSDASLLAILLRTGRQGKDAVALAREMLAEWGGFQGLMSASHEDLLKIKGIGKAKIAQILAAMEIVKRQLRQPLKKLNMIKSPHALFE
jgi:DNA repair protein RadC